MRTSGQASYVALPGDASFQCHGIGPCVCKPPRAVLPLVIHYYGNKDATHELDAITYLPYLPQALFGHGTLPPYWCLHEWKVASDFALKCRQLPMLEWAAQQWVLRSQATDPAAEASPFAVLPVSSHIEDCIPAGVGGSKRSAKGDQNGPALNPQTSLFPDHSGHGFEDQNGPQSTPP